MTTLPNWVSPLAMAVDLAPDDGPGQVLRTPALNLIDQRLWEASRTPGSRLLLSTPPQEGKSSTVARAYPLWRLWQDRTLRIVIVSYDLTLARGHAAAIRDHLTGHPEIGLQVKTDTRAKQEWKLAGGQAGREGGVYAVGMGGPLTGRACDVMIIDDPTKSREEAQSKAFQRRMEDWWTGVGSTRLAADGQVVVVQTRWSDKDMIGYLLGREDGARWDYLNIPAEADHNPNNGETDPLGREPGEFLISAQRRTLADWRQRKASAGSRDWAALYQGRPSALEGDLLKRDHWQQYENALWVVQPDGSRWLPYGEDQDILISVDCAFKDSEQSDYVAIGVWMRRGPNLFGLDLAHGRFDFPETVRQVLAMAARWPQATIKLIEEAANGAAVIASIRAKVSGVIGEIPQGSKYARAAATTPYLEAGNVWLPDPTIPGCAWVGDFVEECAQFPNGAHDDRVDQFSQACNRLMLQPFIADETMDDPEQELVDMQGYSISPY